LIPLTDKWILKSAARDTISGRGSDFSTTRRPDSGYNEETRPSASSIKYDHQDGINGVQIKQLVGES
jgi:hypothetical protein